MRAARSAWIVGGVRTPRVVGAHRDELFEEERVPFRRVHHLVAPDLRPPPGRQAAEQAGRVGVREWLEPDDAPLPTRGGPRRAALEQVAARDADDQHRPRRLRCDVLDEVEHGGLGPVDVIEGGDERAAACERLEEPAHGPLDVHLGRARPGPSRGRRDTRRHRLRLGIAREEVFDLGHAGGSRQVVHDLDQRPVGDALAVRKAAADDHRRLRLDSGDELLEDPGLADPRGACDGDEHAAAAVDGPAETGVQHPQLGPPPDQRHRGPARVAALSGRPAPPPPTSEAAAPCPSASIGPCDRRRAAPSTSRRVCGADDDAAGRRRRLEAGGGVDGVTGDEPMAGCPVGTGHLAGVDADPELEADTEVVLELAVQLGHGVAHLDRRAHRAKRVVLVQDGDAEDRHDRVADVLLDRAAVPLERLPHGGEVAASGRRGGPRGRAARPRRWSRRGRRRRW